MLKTIRSLAAFCLVSASVLGQTAAPQARVDNVADDYFGVRIVDPYRWMENQKSDEMQRWMRAQADYANAYLRKLPLRAGILKRLEELSAGRNVVAGVRRFGNRLLYRRLAAGENTGKFVVRDVAGGAETIVLDLEKMSLADKKSYAVKGMLISPDEKLLAYSIFSGGSENGEIRVLEIATGKDLGVSIGNDAQAIIHKKGLKLDGANPTLVRGYGAYGMNTLEPVFSLSLLPWLERGGVYAVAGVRGGEYGCFFL